MRVSSGYRQSALGACSFPFNRRNAANGDGVGLDMLRVWCVPAICLPIAACGLPRDPEKTSERVAASHELRVGVTDNGEWVDAQSAEPRGIEPALVRQFAMRIGAHVLWTRRNETSLVQSLKHHELDLAIGGFDAQTAWK